MIYITYQQLNNKAEKRPEGYADFVLSLAVQRDEIGFTICKESIEVIRQKFNLEPPRQVIERCDGCGK